MNGLVRCWALGLLVSMACLLGGCATVGQVPCDQARISNLGMPQSYLVRLPLKPSSDRLSRQHAASLDALLELQSMAITAEIERTHLALLAPPLGGQCDIDEVYDAIVENRSGVFGRRLFRSAVFVWTEVFDAGDQTHLQTGMRVFWNDGDGWAHSTAPAVGDGAPLRFVGRFPSSTLLFPPQPIGAGELAALEQLADDPAGVLARRTRPAGPTWPTRFSVALEPGGSDLRLSTRGGEQFTVPWPAMRALAERLAPDMQFVRAVLAYLQFRANGSARAARTSVEALDRFELQRPQAWQRGIALPLAIGDLIKGNLNAARLPGAKAEGQGPRTLRRDLNVEQATELEAALLNSPLDRTELPSISYTNAVVRAPADADILTLSALAMIPSCCEGDGAQRRIDAISRALQEARLIANADPQVARNLLNWYRHLLRLPAGLQSLPAPELQRRANVLARALSEAPP